MSYQLSAVRACAVASGIRDVVVIRLAGRAGAVLRFANDDLECYDSMWATVDKYDWLLWYKKRGDLLKRNSHVCDWPARFTLARRAPLPKLRFPVSNAVAESGPEARFCAKGEMMFLRM